MSVVYHVTGDWDGNGADGPGIVIDNDAPLFWHLKNAVNFGPADFVLDYGGTGDVPVVGDWDGNGADGPGITRQVDTLSGGGDRPPLGQYASPVDDSSELVVAMDLRVQADYGQIYICCPAASSADGGENPPLAALGDATRSRRFVGAAGGTIVLMTPGQWNFDTPMRVEVWPAEPVADTEQWDHEVDIDLDVPDGNLVFEASGGGTPIPATVPPGHYRARISGTGYTEVGFAGAEGDDRYRLRLWPRTTATPPELRKSWPGWQAFR